MLINLEKYFSNNKNVYLNCARYNLIDNFDETLDYELNCNDNINVDFKKEFGVKIDFTRKLFFDPGKLYEVEVGFSAILEFKDTYKNKLDWEEVNLADEFMKNGGFIIMELMSRSSLVISQLTSQCGEIPIITPPMPNNDEHDK